MCLERFTQKHKNGYFVLFLPSICAVLNLQIDIFVSKRCALNKDACNIHIVIKWKLCAEKC